MGIEKESESLNQKKQELEKLKLETFLSSLGSKFEDFLVENDELRKEGGKIIIGVGIDYVSLDNKSTSVIGFKDLPKNLPFIDVGNFLSGLLAFDNRDYLGTIRYLVRVKNPILINDYYYNQALGLAYLHTKDYQIALSFFEKITSKNNDEEYAALMNKAAIFRELGRYDDATKTYTQVLEKNPGDGTGLFALGILDRVIGINLFNKGDYEGAWKSFVNAGKRLSISDNPQSRQYFYKSLLNIGLSQYKLGQLDKANGMFKELAKNEANIRFLSENEVKILVSGLYHSSNGEQESLKLAMGLAQKYGFNDYKRRLELEQENKVPYEGEYTIGTINIKP